ncbi:MAG: PQQ-like beta-propeller repeat protein [Spirochaetes bacterium]|nr:PQQ-like beta-propeller repeat protein [Spirochaetota bacterium]
MKPDRNSLHSVLISILLISFIFSLLFGTIFILNLVQSSQGYAIDNPVLEEERARLEEGESDPELFRELHLMVRRAHFLRITQLRWGRFFLIISMAIFFFCWQILTALYAKSQKPGADPVFITFTGLSSRTGDSPRAQIALSRRAMMVLATILIITGLGGISSSILTENYIAGSPPLPELFKSAEKDKDECPCIKIRSLEANYVSVTEDAAGSWSALRGPSGSGQQNSGQPPLSWDLNTGKNVIWSTPLNKTGKSSPVIYKNKIFITSSDDVNRGFVSAYSLDNGSHLWTYNLSDAGFTTLPSADQQTGAAAPSPAVDSHGVYAIFSGGIVVALSHDGNLLWKHDPGEIDISYGYASSLRVYREHLYIQYDHNGPSRLVALDSKSGETRYTVQRPSGLSWSSPALIDTGKAVLLVTKGSKNVTVSDPLTGDMIWEQDVLSGEVCPLPAFDGTRLFTVSPAREIKAFHLAKGTFMWEYFEVVPDVSSPIAHNGKLYIPTSYGILHCINSETGELIWEHDQVTGWYASPLIIGDYLVLFDRDGESQMIKLDTSDPQVIVNSIGEPVDATPAWTGDRLIIRTASRLLAIGESL